MTLLGRHSSLEEKILGVLATKPASRADSIAAAVAEHGRIYSLQATYQELRKLERNGVVMRHRGTYSLRFLWLVELAGFVNSGVQAYLRSGAILGELPKSGEKKSWKLGDLGSLLNLWSDLTFVAAGTLPEEKRVLYENVQHVWFHTANPINEEQFIRAMARDKVRYVMVSKGKTYLDREYEEVLKKLGATYAYGRSDFPGRENQYGSVIGDLVIDVKLSAALNRHVSGFYSRVNSKADLSSQSVLQFAGLRAPCTLEVSHDAVRARKERQKYISLFGKTFE